MRSPSSTLSGSTWLVAQVEGYFDRLAFGFLLLKSLTALLAYGALLIWFRDEMVYKDHPWTVLIIAFTMFGVWAYRASRNEQGKIFAIFLLCTSGAYAANHNLTLGLVSPNLKYLAEILGRTRFEVFLPWYAWRFLREFPHVYETPRQGQIRRIFEAVSFLLGSLFFVVGVLDFSSTILKIPEGDFQSGVWYLADSAWYGINTLVFLSIVFLFFKMRLVQGEEHRRSELFACSLILGFGPMMMVNFIEFLFPRAMEAMGSNPELLKIRFYTLNFLIFCSPFISFYAVISNRVLDVKQIARSAVQHLLARYSATAIGLIPFAFLSVFLIQNRDQTLVELFSGLKAILLMGLTVLGIVLMRFRQVIFDVIDRRFFRDRYNARVVLAELAEQVRGTRNLTELSDLVGNGVDLALHLERVALMSLDTAHGRYVDPADNIRPLDTASKLVTVLQGSREPLVVDFDDPRSPLTELEDGEKHWLVDGRVELLAPAHALDGNMIGILVLGPKKSQEPFVGEDKDLVKAVCSSVGLVIELLHLKERAPTTVGSHVADPDSSIHGGEEVARECLSCARLFPASDKRCPVCAIELEPTMVPYVLRGQYRFESRLGMGGMAVVYRATDLRLGREVAIKTLPRVSPEAAMRLHREARTAATVSDPGLAAIYGIETWEGMPLLIQEYLQGGTLSDRLLEGKPLNPFQAIETGKTVALALQKIHSVGILHRDLKPSNIGYTQDGHAKLLDFGVARIHHDLRP